MKIGASLEAITGRSIDDRGNPLSGIASSVTQVVRECRLDLIEFPIDAAYIYPTFFTDELLAGMRRLADSLSLDFTVHLPYMWLDLSSINEEMRKAWKNSEHKRRQIHR